MSRGSIPARSPPRLRRHGFEVTQAERYGMLYRHHPGAPSRFLSRRRVFPVAVRAIRAANVVGGRLGNKLTVQAVRR